VLFDRGDDSTVQAGDEGIRFLLVSGKPIEEPAPWYGPIVMNTKNGYARQWPNCNPVTSSSIANLCRNDRASILTNSIGFRSRWGSFD